VRRKLSSAGEANKVKGVMEFICTQYNDCIASDESRRALLADGCLLFIILVVFLVPRPPRTFALHLNGWEPLLDHGLSLAIAGFLFGSCSRADQPRGLGAKLLAHTALAALGEMSFEVYIFQRPMHDTFLLLFGVDSAEVFMVFVVVLWIFAACYNHFVQAPLDSWIRKRTDWARSTEILNNDKPKQDYTAVTMAEVE